MWVRAHTLSRPAPLGGRYVDREGFSLKEVIEYLGHCDIGTTANIYGHLQYKAKVNMSNRMDALLLREQPL